MAVRDNLRVFILLMFLVEGTAWVLQRGSTRRWAARRLFSAELGAPSSSELPDSFEAAVDGAVSSTIAAATDGWEKLSITFDTSAGDATYTMLKSTIPMAQKFVAGVAGPLLALQNEASEAANKTTVRLYFPDAGSAALAQRDWKVGSPEALVPASVRFASLLRDMPEPTDGALVFIAPRASEVDALKPVLKKVEDWGIPIVFINPMLIDQGVVGFGYAGRLLRESLLDTLVCSYYLRTLEWGAVARAYPKAYTVHQADESAPGGYKLLATSSKLPDGETLDDIYEDNNGGGNDRDGGSGNGFLDGFNKFVKGFQSI